MKPNALFSRGLLLLLPLLVTSLSCEKDSPVFVEADFFADATEITQGESISFTNVSTGNPTLFKWEFQGQVSPAASEEEDPVVTYNQPGVFEVRLTVKNEHSENTLIKRNYIVVNSPCSDFDKDNICDDDDNDDDNDGINDNIDTDAFDPNACGDFNNDGCDDCKTDCQPVICPTDRSSSTQYGGFGGDPFIFILPECAVIIGVQVHSGLRIDKVTFLYELQDGEKKEKSFGGGGGETNTVFYFPARLIEVSGRYGDKIDQLQFHFADGTSTPAYGGTGGSPFSIPIEEGKIIGGFFGKSGDEIDALGVYFVE